MAWNYDQSETNLMPGMGSTKVASYKRVWLSSSGILYLPGGGIINGALARDPTNTGYLDTLPAGMMMGKITASGKWAPSIIGAVTSAYTSGETHFHMSVAAAVELVRRIGSSGTGYVIGAPTASGTVAKTALTYSAVDVATGIVTCTNLAADKVIGSWITADDGSEVIRSFIDKEDGIHVADADVQWPRIPLAGIVDVTGLINYPTSTNTTLVIYCKALLAATGPFIFSDNL